MNRLLSVQYLRALAAISVVIYHAVRGFAPGYFIGAAGVDVFFVISGFILWTIASERPVSPLTFLARRAARIVPLYWILTIIVALLAVYAPTFVWDAYPSWPHFLMSMAFIPHLNAGDAPFPILTAGWTLNYEVVFYLIFSACLFAPRRWRLALMSAVLAAIPAYGILVSKAAYYLGSNMFSLEFLAGIWLAEARISGLLPRRQMGWALAITGLAGFAFIQVIGLSSDFWRPLAWGAPAALLVTGLVSVEADGGVHEIPWLRTLGDASYSIYLVHFTASQVFNTVLRNWEWPYVAAVIVAGVGIGLLCYALIERPLLGALRARRLAVLPSGAT